MKLIIEENEEKMSESCMHIVLGAMMQDKRVNISLTSGRSPRKMYEMMIPYVKDQEKFKDIQYYIFDDGPYIGQEHGPIWEEMHELFYTPANIPDSQIHSVTEDNWETYDEEIRNGGGLDVMVIGVVIALAVHQWIVILIRFYVTIKLQSMKHIDLVTISLMFIQWDQRV